MINNAGILRDVSFKRMKDSDWDMIVKVIDARPVRIAARGVSVHLTVGTGMGRRCT